ncbi:MAG: c-type cytochrome domain-containing protein [Verrucomicrobiota bacterium]|nr:hypothetical protein [Limisphaera sp.]MDW8381284.1 c-type cytochrome domain-containing protein [Verrucomicrobiota bacterium]
MEFLRDIRPILERSCFRCHGPERPRGGLRLDRREDLLRGSDAGPVIVLSNSAASRLIHVVARAPHVPEDLWMPPDGKAPPLTAEEIGRLRAWIDQGLPWAEPVEQSADRVEATLGMGWSVGSGPESRLRARWQQPSGWNGGLEQLTWLHEPPEGARFTLLVRALRDDTLLQMDWLQPGWGWLHAGVSQYRVFYSDRGQWPWASGQAVGLLSHEPALDIGRSWIEWDLIRENWPGLRIGYEHAYRDGTRSLTAWSASPDFSQRRLIWPASQAVEEDNHLFRFHFLHQAGQWHLEDELRLQWINVRRARTNAGFLSPPESSPIVRTRATQTHESFQAANAFRFERSLRPWLRATGGLLSSRYDANGSSDLADAIIDVWPGYLRRWHSPSLTVAQTAHAANANLIAEAGAGWITWTGVQLEKTRQQTLGRASFDFEWSPGDVWQLPATQENARDRFVLTEMLGLRWTGLRHLTLYADARAQQDSVELFEEQLGGDAPFRRDSLARTHTWETRVGLECTPWTRVSVGLSHRHRQSNTDFDHNIDLVPTDFGNFSNPSYPAFIRQRWSRSDQVQIRLGWQPSTRWRMAFLYRYWAGRSQTATDPLDGFDPITMEPVPGFYTPGRKILGADTDLHTYSLQTILRPASRWSLQAQAIAQDQHTRSGVDHAELLPAWVGRTYRIHLKGRWQWTKQSELEFEYQWAMSDFHQDVAATVFPIGILWQEHFIGAGVRRQWTEHLSFHLRYGLWHYEEPQASGSNDSLAHLAWMSVTWQWR